MVTKKYTLPRHTNLANQGPRIGAFLIDIALTLALTIGLIFGCFAFVFKSKTKPLENKITEERLKSHLFFESESGDLIYYSSDSENQPFVEAIAYFYTYYIPYIEVNADQPLVLDDGTQIDKKEYFTYEWLNKTVLQVEEDGSAYFEYVKEGEIENKNVLAKIKDDIASDKLNSFLQLRWIEANSDLNNLEYFKNLMNEYTFYNTLEFVISAIISIVVVYIVVPLFFKNGVTLGKKALGLCLADSDGYIVKNEQLFLRAVPPVLIVLILLIPIWKTLLSVLLLLVGMLLISFTFVMASPKKMSLHDFTARTIVVNRKTSILFENGADEEAYIAKEDNIDLSHNVYGDEPELKYEK